ncbi:GreA/GreB family elongation factor [Methylophaga lonarensis MPL]|uniref:GreA/GreB family elongation factor n=1 Tax=Methylophaga lonarensis MPL TaxID=1286106 RepID=M7PIX2_9GAMM|nr:nucleoside diphosphate kinase regulator [Methylophaga lonarensis]EMR13820.1 GreA/GreB family elongation factor [Methylophaga lonarensis MPL]
MATKPNIIVSEQDAERLDKLLASLPEKEFSAREALEAELDRAEILPSTEMPNDVVTMNSTVRFRVSSSKDDFCLTLVYPKDMDDSGNKISILAPVGSALLGLRQGDEIEWPGSDGRVMQVRIEEIIYQPEREGEYHR